MPTAHRRQWMRDYMREYRQGKVRVGLVKKEPYFDEEENSPLNRRERLKEAHRLYSFLWRLSKLLSYQYEILLYVQFGPEYGVFENNDGTIDVHTYNLLNDENLMDDFSICFKGIFEPLCIMGGTEIFRIFHLIKYDMRFNQFSDSIVGVLDKAALLKNLQKLSYQGGSKWEKVLNKVRAEARQGTWQALDFPSEGGLWLDNYTYCSSLECPGRKSPTWDSSELYAFLCGWAMGIRKVGKLVGSRKGESMEWPRARSFQLRRIIRSPLLFYYREKA